MSRQFRAKRNGLTQSDDIQRQIDYLPSTVSIYRKGGIGDGIHASRGPESFVGSFQGLLVIHERLSKSMIDISEPYGQAAKTVYVLITRANADKFGNPINLLQGDFAFDGSYSYLVDSVVNFGYKNEAILEYVQ